MAESSFRGGKTRGYFCSVFKYLSVTTFSLYTTLRHSERSDSGVKNPMLHGKSLGSFARLRMTEKGKWSQELWVMYADTKKARKIIASWRYPGVSPVREPPPFPEDLLDAD